MTPIELAQKRPCFQQAPLIAASNGAMSLSNTPAKGSGRVRHRCGLRACDGYKPACQWRALRTLMPAPAAAASCVLPSISSFLRNTLTCPSVTMELLPAPFHGSAVRTATTGKSNCRTRQI